MVFTAAEVAYLVTQRLGRLATVQASGTLQGSAVGFTYNPALYPPSASASPTRPRTG